MTKQDIVLIGGGGHCHAVIDVIELTKAYNIIGVIDQAEKVGSSVMGYKVIGTDDDLPSIRKKCQNATICVGHIKTAAIRQKIADSLKTLNFTCPVIISPLAYVAPTAQIEAGSIIMHHALVNANVQIGQHCIINTKSLIEHDAKIGDFCHISTASVVNGSVDVHSESFFGSNAVSKQNIQVSGFIKAGSIVK